MGNDNKIGLKTHVGRATGGGALVQTQREKRGNGHDATDKLCGKRWLAQAAELRPSNRRPFKTAGKLETIGEQDVLSTGGKSPLKLTTFAAARKADAAAPKAVHGPHAEAPWLQPRAVADFADLRNKVRNAALGAAALRAEATVNTARELESGKNAYPRTHLNRAGAFIQSNLTALRAAADVLRLEVAFTLLGIDFDTGRSALEAAMPQTGKPVPFDATNPEHLEALRKVATTAGRFEQHRAESSGFFQKAGERFESAQNRPVDPSGPGDAEARILKDHFAAVVIEEIDALMAYSLDDLIDDLSSLAQEAPELQPMADTRVPEMKELREMERTLVTEMMLLELPGLDPENAKYRMELARGSLNKELAAAADRLEYALEDRFGATWADRLVLPAAPSNAEQPVEGERRLADAIAGLRRGEPLDPALKYLLTSAVLERAGPDAQRAIVSVLEETEDLVEAWENLDWLFGQRIWESEREVLPSWKVGVQHLRATHAALEAFLQGHTTPGAGADSEFDLYKACKDCGMIDPNELGAFLQEFHENWDWITEADDHGRANETIFMMLIDRYKSVENLRALSENGVLNQDLVRLLADGQPQLKDQADNPFLTNRARAANTFAVLTELAVAGELPSEILGSFDRHAELNRGLHRAAAEARGEPPEIGEARADLELTKRRVAERLLALDPRRGAKAITLSGKGLSGVRVDTQFIEAIREQNPDAGREIGLLLAQVTLLQRMVEPFNQLRDARQALDAARALPPELEEAERLKARAEERLKAWEIAAAIPRAQIARDRAQSELERAQTELERVETEHNAAHADIEGDHTLARHTTRTELEALGARERALLERYQQADSERGRARISLEKAQAALTAAIEVQNRMPLPDQSAEADHAIDRVDTVLRFRQEENERLPDEPESLVFGLDAKDLTAMGLPADDAAAVEEMVRKLASVGLMSSAQVAKTTAAINHVIKAVIRRPIGQAVIRSVTDLTDEQKANIFLDRFFRTVARAPDSRNLRADDQAVCDGVRRRIGELEGALSDDARERHTEARTVLDEAMAALAVLGAKLSQARQDLAQAEATLPRAAVEAGVSYPFVASTGNGTVAASSQLEAAELLLEAIGLRRSLDNAARKTAARKETEGLVLPPQQDGEARYEALCKRLRNIDFDTLTLGDRPLSRNVDGRIRAIASKEVSPGTTEAERRKNRALESLANLLVNRDRYTRQIAKLIVDSSRTGEEIQQAKRALDEAVGPERAAFLRDTIRAAVLSARPQALGISHRRFDQFDASAHRTTVDGILANWGVDVDTHRSLIDEVVFSAPSLTRADIDRIGAAVMDETVKAYDLEQWLREMGDARAEGQPLTTDGDQPSGARTLFREVGNLPFPPDETMIDEIFSLVRSMVVQEKLTISVGSGTELSIGFSVDVAELGMSGSKTSIAAIEIKCGKDGFEVRFRFGDATGATASGGVGATAGLAQGGVFATVSQGTSDTEGVSLHFASVEAVQAFLERIFTKQEVTAEDWRDLSLWEAATQRAASGGASAGASSGLGTTLGVLKASLGRVDLSAGYHQKMSRGTYKNAFTNEIKDKAVSIISFQGVAQAGLTSVVRGNNTAAQATGFDPEFLSEDTVSLPDVGVAHAMNGTFTKLTRRKEIYASDGIFSGAGYFTALPAFSRDPEEVLEQYRLDQGDSTQFLDAFEDKVTFDGKTQTFREWIRDALAKARPNESIVVESKMRPAAAEQIQQRMERIARRERDLSLAEPKKTIARHERAAAPARGEDAPPHVESREAISAEIQKLKHEVQTLRLDKNSYQPEAILLVPARETNRTDTLSFVVGRKFRSAVGALRQGTAYVAAPKPSTEIDPAAVLRTGVTLRRQIADKLIIKG